MGFVIGTILLLILFSLIGGGMWYAFKIVNASVEDTSIGNQIETAQEFLPFKDIMSHMVDLGNHQYRMYVEVSSINYFLRTDEEKKLAEVSYQDFVNSLSHPITIFVQTRVANNDVLLEELRQDYLKTVERYPSLAQHAEQNFEDMLHLYQERGTDREKRKYIIVPFDAASELAESNEYEKQNYAFEELQQRSRLIIDGLSGVGLTARILTTDEILDLIMSTYHKQNYKHTDAIKNGEYGSLHVEGENQLNTLSDDARMDWILYSTQLKLQQEVFNTSSDSVIRKQTKQAIQELELLRKQIKQNQSEGGSL